MPRHFLGLWGLWYWLAVCVCVLPLLLDNGKSACLCPSVFLYSCGSYRIKGNWAISFSQNLLLCIMRSPCCLFFTSNFLNFTPIMSYQGGLWDRLAVCLCFCIFPLFYFCFLCCPCRVTGKYTIGSIPNLFVFQRCFQEKCLGAVGIQRK
jgi:hypothetical protein